VKKTTRKAKAKKTPARRKATAKKTAAPKARAKKKQKKKAAAKAIPAKTKKKAATPAAAAPKVKSAAAAPEKKPAPKKAATRKVVLPPPPPDAHPKLGVKHTCFRCGAKFYDLFRPEPLCPKCGADQREAPKVDTKRKLAPPPKRARKRAMAPLLDEEEDEPLYDDLGDSVADLEPAGAELDDPTAESEDEGDL
jgi:hypothetical protein